MKQENCQNCSSMDVTTRLKDFFLDRAKYDLEWQMLRYMGMTLFLLLIIGVLVYYGFANFSLFRYNWWLIYLLITIVVVIGSVWHVKAHQGKVNSMLGMMIGMTMGMQAGMMIGVIIGSTNGMFMGGVIGVIFGVSIGAYTGNCCGLMGILNGMLMGTMGGTMGPMIALMMKVDHILWFMPLFTFINVIILLGLNFLVYEELVEGKEVVKKPADFFTFFTLCLVLMVFLVLIIVYGYQSAFAAL